MDGRLRERDGGLYPTRSTRYTGILRHHFLRDDLNDVRFEILLLLEPAVEETPRRK
jgi:hypothetical protein